MNKKVLVVGIIVILVILIFAFSKKGNIEIAEYNTFSTGNIVVNNVDGEYTIYDQKGKKITNITEEEKYKLKIYELDPNYEELPSADEGGEITEIN